MNSYNRTGYLKSNFKIFHLKDQKKHDIEYHYHDFHKILIFLSGNVTYSIEGRSYELQPNDIVFVNSGEVHKPIINDNSTYERIIIYISKDYLDSYSEKNNDLSLCFKKASSNKSHVLRVHSFSNSKLGSITKELEASFNTDAYANDLYHNILFLEFMIQLNRLSINDGIEYIKNSSPNQKIVEIINYVNNNLTDEISIDSLAKTFFLSRYYLMHIFKEETGYTIGNYITNKRLLLAKDFILHGMPITAACYESGFKNYSTFSRAYKKTFGTTPTNAFKES
ncbi:AraC family transcriptional regulator [Lachnobacterium bovis]|uniref:AraC-type DNA-binding protein n=1 Tax=Lachnobacterium bovis TaxID=140626 RepID=A0A1H9RHC8_9FIRM|nr:AraC family transcriptional regulator [Lachnobacterium bovis]SER72211.1 AraC-type DNA-binding protein [Lachnobacterium bovis]